MEERKEVYIIMFFMGYEPPFDIRNQFKYLKKSRIIIFEPFLLT